MLAFLLQTNFFDHEYALVRLTATPMRAATRNALSPLEFQTSGDSFARRMAAISASYRRRSHIGAVC